MTSFLELGLSEKVLNAVTAAGYQAPTPIQKASIPHILQHKDVLGIAQTGTGKTASFVLPILTLLEKTRARARMPRVLILEPTRELAAQVDVNFRKYGVDHRFSTAMLIGGVSFEEQERALGRGADVIIATPGRLLDLFSRGKIMLTGIEIFVIDEADRMLDMGFIPDIEQISKLIPFTRQTLFFSATMAPEIGKITEKFLHNPVTVEVTPIAKTAKTIEQQFVKTGVKSWEKRAILRDLLQKEDKILKNAIIFCNRKKDIAELYRSCVKHGFNIGALHGDMDQHSRTTMLANFKTGKLKYLIASDVAARGLDIEDVSHVFNYDVPVNPEDYIHRIGRTGRAGRLGKSFTLVTPKDTKLFDAIITLTNIEPSWLEIKEMAPAQKSKATKKDIVTEKSNKDLTDVESASLPSSAKKKKQQKPPSSGKVAELTAKKPCDLKQNRNNQNHELPEKDSITGFGKNIPAFMLIKT